MVELYSILNLHFFGVVDRNVRCVMCDMSSGAAHNGRPALNSLSIFTYFIYLKYTRPIIGELRLSDPLDKIERLGIIEG